jgi:hypothetical protein
LSIDDVDASRIVHKEHDRGARERRTERSDGSDDCEELGVLNVAMISDESAVGCAPRAGERGADRQMRK